MKALCPTHKAAADEWVSCVQDLAQHPTMRPLDDGRNRATTAGGNALKVLHRQVGAIRKACAAGEGCA